MCGRYSLSVEMKELLAYFGLIELGFAYNPRYNIAPGQDIPAVIARQGRLRSGMLRWGLVPSWAKDPSIGSKLLNARAETAAEKPSFSGSFRRKRCVIPADGFYEWRKLQDGRKQPMRIRLKDSPLFVMAGLYDTWIRPDGSKLHTCTILTTEPNELMASIHNRMPVILHKEQIMDWLDPEMGDVGRLHEMLRPFPADRMTAYAVKTTVNNVKNDSIDCILPVEA
jgi:putative SOS response-associated peptidase YedK